MILFPLLCTDHKQQKTSAPAICLILSASGIEQKPDRSKTMNFQILCRLKRQNTAAGFYHNPVSD